MRTRRGDAETRGHGEGRLSTAVDFGSFRPRVADTLKGGHQTPSGPVRCPRFRMFPHSITVGPIIARAASFVLALTLATLAQATSPKFNSTTPSGGQRGTDLDLRFNGQRLEDAQEIVFYSPGIEVLKLDPARTNGLKARIRITKDCPLGEHPLRIRAASGVSDVRTFWVGPFKTLEEIEPNNEVGKAQPVPLNVTISGTIGPEDVDYFRIEAKRGQRISAEIEAMRLGRGAFDPYLAIHDSNGEVLSFADDTALLMQDCFLSILAPKDGSYIIQVRETSYGGRPEFAYRLHVGTFPRPTGVYPAGGKAGESLSIDFLGDPTGNFTQELKLPSVPSDKFGAYAEQGGLSSPSPNWIRVSPFPNVLKAAPNQDKEHATSADMLPPLAFNGIIAQKGEADWFRFKAKKGQPLDLNVYARRLRSPLDSVLELFDEKGKSIASNDDTGGPDSYLKFTPSEDGEYLLRIKDQLGSGGSDYTYRIEITPVQPSLMLTIPQVARNDSQTRQYIVIPKGNRFATMISAKRVNFSGDLAFSADDLPAGVTLHADTMPAKVDAMPLVFEAQSDTALGGKFIDLSAKVADATNEIRGQFKHEIELVQGPNNTYYYGTRVDKLYLAVTKEAPFKLRIVEPKVPLVQSGTMDLKVMADRRPGYDEPINVKMLWNPPGVSSLPDATIPKGSSHVDYHLNATADAQTRTWKIAILATAPFGSALPPGGKGAKGEVGTVWVSSQLANLEIGPAILGGKIETVSVTPGQSTKLVCKLDSKEPFEGKATVKLMGLPEKVTTSDVQITKDDKEVIFDLKVDPKCPTGSHRALFCSLSFKKNSELVSQAFARDGILRIVPPKAIKPAETKVAARTEPKAK